MTRYDLKADYHRKNIGDKVGVLARPETMKVEKEQVRE